MSLPFDSKRVRDYAVEFDAAGQRLRCEFRLDDGSRLFVADAEITPEIEHFISSLGSPRVGSRPGIEDRHQQIRDRPRLQVGRTSVRCILTTSEPTDDMILPETDKCLTCHNSIKKDSPSIQKLAQFKKDGQPVPWVRVYRLADYCGVGLVRGRVQFVPEMLA